MTPKQVQGLWVAMGQAWGARFHEQFGTTAPDIWQQALERIPVEHCRSALLSLVKSGTGHPPTLPEFIEAVRRTRPVERPALLDEKRPVVDPEAAKRNIAKLRALLRRDTGGAVLIAQSKRGSAQ